jgi:rubredoxin
MLTERGIYPTETVEGNPNSVYEMVKGWGPRWFEWKGLFNCPHCGAELRDLVHGPPFKLEFAIIERDRVVRWECRVCSKSWLPETSS